MKRLVDTKELALELNRPIRQIRSFVQGRKISVFKVGWRTNLFDPDKARKEIEGFEVKAVSGK